jgi:hypothetical protein
VPDVPGRIEGEERMSTDEKTPVERAAEMMADRCGEDWDPTHEDDALDMLTAAVEDRDGLAEALFEADWTNGRPWADAARWEREVYMDRANAVAAWLTGGAS